MLSLLVSTYCELLSPFKFLTEFCRLFCYHLVLKRSSGQVPHTNQTKMSLFLDERSRILHQSVPRLVALSVFEIKNRYFISLFLLSSWKVIKQLILLKAKIPTKLALRSALLLFVNHIFYLKIRYTCTTHICNNNKK